MKRLCSGFYATALAFALAGCNLMGGQPELRHAEIKPDELNPGDDAVITVTAKDPDDIIDRIEGVVVGEDRVTFKLRDDGEEPDEKADDEVWTMAVSVPFLAPTAPFNLEFTAYRRDGTPVPVRVEGERVPLKTSLSFTITPAEPDKE